MMIHPVKRRRWRSTGSGRAGVIVGLALIGNSDQLAREGTAKRRLLSPQNGLAASCPRRAIGRSPSPNKSRSCSSPGKETHGGGRDEPVKLFCHAIPSPSPPTGPLGAEANHDDDGLRRQPMPQKRLCQEARMGEQRGERLNGAVLNYWPALGSGCQASPSTVSPARGNQNGNLVMPRECGGYWGDRGQAGLSPACKVPGQGASHEREAC